MEKKLGIDMCFQHKLFIYELIYQFVLEEDGFGFILKERVIDYLLYVYQ